MQFWYFYINGVIIRVEFIVELFELDDVCAGKIHELADTVKNAGMEKCYKILGITKRDQAMMKIWL